MFRLKRLPIRLAAVVVVCLSTAVSVAASDFVSITTLAGSSKAHDIFKDPQAVAISASSGIVYVADRGHHQIAAIDAAGMVTVLAGSGNPGNTDGVGMAAQFKQPHGIAIDATRRLIT